jgi:hypothetical protein
LLLLALKTTLLITAAAAPLPSLPSLLALKPTLLIIVAAAFLPSLPLPSPPSSGLLSFSFPEVNKTNYLPRKYKYPSF